MHDAIYKQLYADPRMIEDVLRGFFPGSRASGACRGLDHRLRHGRGSDREGERSV